MIPLQAFRTGGVEMRELDSRRRGVLLTNLGTEGDPASVRAALTDVAGALKEALPQDWEVLTASARGRPNVGQVMRQIRSIGIADLTVVSLYPQFSSTASGVVMRELYRALCAAELGINLVTRTSWFDDVGYVNAQARMLAEYATSRNLLPPETQLVFSAQPPAAGSDHTYVRQVRRTADLVATRLGWPADHYTVCIGELGTQIWKARDGLRLSRDDCAARVLLCKITHPVSGGDAHSGANLSGGDAPSDTGGRVLVCPSLNSYGPFVTALKNLVLQGPRPVGYRQVAPKPLLRALAGSEPQCTEPGALVMVGASLSNGLEPRFGPRLRYSDGAAFKAVKKSRRELFEFLAWVKERNEAIEAFVWDTCQRIEFYGWLRDPDDLAGRECAIARIRHQLYGREQIGLEVNVLFGADAWHHLMRTASGLNSALPGDTDVAEQLRTALRIAERAKTAGVMSSRLVDEAVEASLGVRQETAWSEFSTGYCFAALSRMREVGTLEFDECRHVVIGGSTTSRSVVATLSQHFRVPQRQMTLAYRCNHGQMKLLRAAIGSGKRLRVNSYCEDAVIREIADADFVYFGIDHPESVVDAGKLRGLRNYATRPLHIIDFNSFGSLNNSEQIDGVSIWTARDLDQAVTAHAEIMRARSKFAQALEEAEEWLANRVSVGSALYGGNSRREASTRSTAP